MNNSTKLKYQISLNQDQKIPTNQFFFNQKFLQKLKSKENNNQILSLINQKKKRKKSKYQSVNRLYKKLITLKNKTSQGKRKSNGLFESNTISSRYKQIRPNRKYTITYSINDHLKKNKRANKGLSNVSNLLVKTDKTKEESVSESLDVRSAKERDGRITQINQSLHWSQKRKFDKRRTHRRKWDSIGSNFFSILDQSKTGHLNNRSITKKISMFYVQKSGLNKRVWGHKEIDRENICRKDKTQNVSWNFEKHTQVDPKQNEVSNREAEYQHPQKALRQHLLDLCPTKRNEKNSEKGVFWEIDRDIPRRCRDTLGKICRGIRQEKLSKKQNQRDDQSSEFLSNVQGIQPTSKYRNRRRQIWKFLEKVHI